MQDLAASQAYENQTERADGDKCKEKMKQEVVMIGGGETGSFLHNQLLSVYYETNANRT